MSTARKNSIRSNYLDEGDHWMSNATMFHEVPIVVPLNYTVRIAPLRWFRDNNTQTSNVGFKETQRTQWGVTQLLQMLLMGEITEWAMKLQCSSWFLSASHKRDSPPSILLWVIHLQGDSEEITIPRMVIFVSMRPEEHSKGKLNHFKSPGWGRSLNEQCNNVLQVCYLRPPQLYCQ